MSLQSGETFGRWQCINYLFQKWKTCGLHENLRLPLLNKFVPTCFDLLPREKNVGYILFNS